VQGEWACGVHGEMDFGAMVAEADGVVDGVSRVTEVGEAGMCREMWRWKGREGIICGRADLSVAEEAFVVRLLSR
jgi:hypothetical protein